MVEVERSGERIYEAGLLIGRSGLLADAYAWFEGRPAATPEIGAAVRLLKELQA